MGFLTQEDSTLYRCFFKEMAHLRGFEVQYRYVIKTDPTIYTEFQSKLSDPINIDIIYESNPKVSTLNKIGWVSENPGDKPYIAMLPFDTPHLTTESVISIPPFIEIDSRARDFKITSINTIIEFPDCWICTIAPIFDNRPVRDNYSESNYNYFENDDSPDNDTPSNFKYINY